MSNVIDDLGARGRAGTRRSTPACPRTRVRAARDARDGRRRGTRPASSCGASRVTARERRTRPACGRRAHDERRRSRCSGAACSRARRAAGPSPRARRARSCTAGRGRPHWRSAQSRRVRLRRTSAREARPCRAPASRAAARERSSQARRPRICRRRSRGATRPRFPRRARRSRCEGVSTPESGDPTSSSLVRAEAPRGGRPLACRNDEPAAARPRPEGGG